MPFPAPVRSRGASGSTLVAMVVVIAVMSVMMTVAAEAWSFIVRREKERELIFRGLLIKAAIEEYQATGRSLPTSLEDLTKKPRPVLRRVPPDPMTARYGEDGELVKGTGEWKLLQYGSAPPGTQPTGPDGPRTGRAEGRTVGPITGVASRSDELSISVWGNVPADSPYTSWTFQIRAPTQASGGLTDAPELPLPPGFGGLRAPGGPPVLTPLPTVPGAGQPSRPPGGLRGRPGGSRLPGRGGR